MPDTPHSATGPTHADVSLDAQIRLTGGADFWHTPAIPEVGLPQVMVTDGPHGVRKQAGAADHIGLNTSVPATCFPPAVAQAATWNPALIERMGEALGRESRAHGVGILLGPGANLKRSPLCGRNFEYYSEDPHLTGELGSAFVRGVQSQGVGTSVKHFAANNQETDRMRRDSQIDERTLREVYLRGFEKIITTTQPWTVMASYNKVNGIYATQNRHLLTEILRDEWGFDGFVVSDWAAVKDPVAALNAGLDLEMPANPEHDDTIRTALAAGEIQSATLTRAYDRIERVLRRAATTVTEAGDAGEDFDADAHHQLAQQVAEQAAVLLDNDGTLPLGRGTDLAIVGEFARTPRYQGAGSSRVHPTRLDTALDAIETLLGRPVPFAPGFTTDATHPVAEDAHEEAVRVAAAAEVVLVFLGLGEDHESEGYDRTVLDLPEEQLSLLEDILAVNRNVVVVLSNGASVTIPFAGTVRAILEGWLLGQAGGTAIADILFGEVNPSGKITETIPLRLTDVPSYPYFPGDTTGVRYGEGLFMGYRGYDVRHTPVGYPFGHGLSYTTFDYTHLTVTADPDQVRVEVTITNTGTRAGREIVQAYIAVPDSQVVRVPQELKAFTDVTLQPGESQRVQLDIPVIELAYWDVEGHGWVVENAAYEVSVGSSSRDLRHTATLTLPGEGSARPLTIDATLAEALAHPGFAAAVTATTSAGLVEGQSENDLRMLGGIPLWSIALLSGQPRGAMEDIVARTNTI